MRGVDNSFVVVQRRIEFFNIFLFMRVAAPCLQRAATSFFCAPKKMKQKKGAPAGGLHSANRLYANIKEGGLSSLDGQRTSAANRTHALCTLIAY